jgi:hypothetical protein
MQQPKYLGYQLAWGCANDNCERGDLITLMFRCHPSARGYATQARYDEAKQLRKTICPR